MGAVLAPREADRRKGADEQEACRDEPHGSRIGTGSDGLEPDPAGNRRPSREEEMKSTGGGEWHG